MKLKTFIISTLFLLSCSLFSRGHAPGWYTGPLISPTASNLPPGEACFNPYVFVTQTKPDNVDEISLDFFNLFQYGLTIWLDVSIAFQGFYNHQKGISSSQYGDTYVKFGFQLLKENPDGIEPNVRLGIYENFPTGRFNKLDQSLNGIDTNGSGAYETHFNLAFSKEIFISERHPFLLRLYLDYFFNTFAHVTGFHAYGGSFDTNGKVRPPRIFYGDFSFEYHITKRFGFAMDVIYTQANASSFSGNPGTNADGTIAVNTVPKAKQFSLAPALEYSFTPDFGIVYGVWFSLNGSYFLSYAFALSYAF